MSDAVEELIEVTLVNPEDFLKVKETLTRIGVASFKDKKLYQSCHILHKRTKYYIVHFKELFKLDGRPSDISEEDIGRRNTITNLLEEWGLVNIVNSSKVETPTVEMSKIKVIPFNEKKNWELVPKYSIGKKL